MNSNRKKIKFSLTVKQSIPILLSIMLSIVVFSTIAPDVDATHKILNDLVGDESITLDLIPGINQIFYRDSTNTDPQTHSIDVDASPIKAGFITISVTEEDSNLNPSGMDVILSSATSTTSGLDETPVTLTETGDDTGIFTGSLFVSPGGGDGVLQLGLGDEITVLYEPQHDAFETTDAGEVIGLGVGRFSAELTGVSGSGTVDISDTTFIESPCKMVTATHPVTIKFSPGITADDITVTISYANIPERSPPPNFLEMGYRPDSTSPWVIIGGTLDTDAQTITAFNTPITFFDPITMEFVSTLEGQYALGRGTDDCPGGGGGGLVRQGLVVNALVGVSSLSGLFSGGSGDGPSNPTFGEGSMSVLGSGEQGFGGIISGGDENPFDTITVVEIGEKVTVRVPLYENQGINFLDQVIWYLNFAGENYDRASIDTYILFDRGVVTVVDPHEKLESANIEIIQEDAWNLIVKGDLVFKNTMIPSNFLFYSVDLDRHFGEILIPNALEVIEPSILLADEQKEIGTAALQLTTTDDMTEVKLTEIPLWVKSNALWWQQKQIDDSDFIAGIEYLIQKAIINIDDEDILSTGISQDIPGWIQDVAGFWANDSMTDDEFIQAMQWLISKGIITVQT